MGGISGEVAVRLIPGYAPIYAIAAASIAGTLFFAFAPSPVLAALFANSWSPLYLIAAPFIHAGVGHVLLNILGLHFIGGQMLLPQLGQRRFVVLFGLAALAGGVVNNLLGAAPAVGISATVLAMLSCSLYRWGRTPMKLLLIHDLLRLRPFPLWKVAAFVVALDVAGIIFGWRLFAHWAHLAGFATGGIFGWAVFIRRRQKTQRTLH